MAVQDPLNADNFYRVIVCIVDILSDIIVCPALIVVTAEWYWFSLSVNIINCYLNCCGLACNSYYCLCLVYMLSTRRLCAATIAALVLQVFDARELTNTDDQNTKHRTVDHRGLHDINNRLLNMDFCPYWRSIVLKKQKDF